MHFALLGGSILGILSWWAKPEAERIVVTPEIVESLVLEREELLGHGVGASERDRLIQGYIDQQVLAAEALKLGLDKSDNRITNLLADQMRSILSVEPVMPTEEQIDSYYNSEVDRYRSPDVISIEHIYYYFPQNLDTVDYGGILAQLETKVLDWKDLGDRFWLGAILEGYSRESLTTMLGEAFTDQIFRLDLEKWHGPLKSSRGTHLVRITQNSEGQVLSREQARSLVVQDWLRKQREDLLQRKIDQIKESYHIEIKKSVEGK